MLAGTRFRPIADEPVTPRYHAHPTALIESPHVGAETRIWAYCHILPGR